MFYKRKRGTRDGKNKEHKKTQATKETQRTQETQGTREKRKTGDMRDTTDRRGHREHKGHKQHRGLKGTPGTQVRQKSQGTQGDTEVIRGLYLNFLRYWAPMGTSLTAEQATLCK